MEKMSENKLLNKIPDVNNADEMIKVLDDERQVIYFEGFCDECLSGTGFPTMEQGNTENKLNYIRDLIPNIIKNKEKENNWKCISNVFYETEDKINLYGILILSFIKLDK